MNQQGDNKRAFVDVEQPPHVNVSSTTYPPAQNVPGYAVAQAPASEPLPCCGLGVGWTLFILGFIISPITWLIGSLLLCCGIHKKDPREKAGCVACSVAAVIITIIVLVLIFAHA